MEVLINNKSPSYIQPEFSSETHPISNANAKAKATTTKSLLHLKNIFNHHHHHREEMVVSYKECLKNHAASLGGHALDGCGEFMPTPTATPTDPTSLKCAACGCHRNFHRRDPYDGPLPANSIHHRPPPPSPNPSSSPSRSPTHSIPPSPVPYSAFYSSSAPHMLLALSTAAYSDEYQHHHHNMAERTTENNNRRKRSRTKFSKEQKAKMQGFAERLCWRMPKNEEKLIEGFCHEIGVDRGVFKVWMHNNKNTFGKNNNKDQNSHIFAVANLNLENNNSSGNEDDEDNGSKSGTNI